MSRSATPRVCPLCGRLFSSYLRASRIRTGTVSVLNPDAAQLETFGSDAKIPESSHPLAGMKPRREAWYGWNPIVD